MITTIADLRKALEPFKPEQRIRVNQTSVIDEINRSESGNAPLNITTVPTPKFGEYGKFGDPNAKPQE